jgi:four helix bundle protein
MTSDTTKTREMKERTKQFALRVIRLTESLPKGRVGDVLGRQLLRSGTSVGANYRAACRGRSTAEFMAKLGIVEEELDECMYWLELIVDESLISQERLAPLMAEANELLAITVASIKTARNNRKKTDMRSKTSVATKGQPELRTPQSAL